MTLDEWRQRFPQFNDMPDEEVIRRRHQAGKTFDEPGRAPQGGGQGGTSMLNQIGASTIESMLGLPALPRTIGDLARAGARKIGGEQAAQAVTSGLGVLPGGALFNAGPSFEDVKAAVVRPGSAAATVMGQQPETIAQRYARAIVGPVVTAPVTGARSLTDIGLAGLSAGAGELGADVAKRYFPSGADYARFFSSLLTGGLG